MLRFRATSFAASNEGYKSARISHNYFVTWAVVTKNAELGGVHIVAAPLQMNVAWDWRCGSTASQRQSLDVLVPGLVHMLKTRRCDDA
jgi:hypothetical protein